MIALFSQDIASDVSAQQYMNIVPSEGRNHDWYTPAKYVKAAYEVMGDIDLDPASCAFANQIIKAVRYYSKEQNGLAQDWTCRTMWLNPPYGTTNGKSNLGKFTRRLVHEYQRGTVKQAIIVTSTKTDTSWFTLLWQFPICFANHLVEFYRVDHKRALHPLGTAFTYLGPNEDAFIKTFSRFGRIARAIDTPSQPVISHSLWEGTL
jgi:ParB family transcriptional regulator, chromosome partitioning protein